MAPVTDPAPVGRQRWLLAVDGVMAGSHHLWSPTPLAVQVFCPGAAAVGGAHWKEPQGEDRSCAGPWPRRRNRSVSPGARAARVRLCRTLALRWMGFSRGCGGRRRPWDRGGGLWVSEVPRRGRVLLNASLGPSPSPANLEPWSLSSWSRLMPPHRPNGQRLPRFHAAKSRKVVSPQAP
jgi:hypothetical protein